MCARALIKIVIVSVYNGAFGLGKDELIVNHQLERIRLRQQLYQPCAGLHVPGL
jgi:hypothetical protein